ncbi:MAG TPA: hypothetical protein VIX82_10660 [Solirubrobacteraceae bacterium]
MGAGYADPWITADSRAVHIRGYYFPWGTKRIPFESIRAVERVRIGPLTGKLRLWGTANPRYWASLDPRRPMKPVALILDLAGSHIKPVLTPDDPAALVAAILEHSSTAVLTGVKGPAI